MSAGPTGNDQRRRVTRTRICSDWNGVGVLTQNLPDNTGLAQHQIYLACTSVPSAGTAEVWVRPAKMAYFVPVGTIDLSVSGSGQILLPAVIDGVELTFPTALSGGTIKAGILSIADDFTTSHDQSDVDRRRFGNAVFSPGWTGAAPTSCLCEEQSGFSQHQISLSGGTGTVRLFGRPTADTVYVDVGIALLNSSGDLRLFSGMYDAYMMQASGTVTGSISAQVISVGEEMFFPASRFP